MAVTVTVPVKVQTLAQLRESHRLTQREVAEELGVSQQVVSALELGTLGREAADSLAASLAELYDVSLWQLRALLPENYRRK